MVRMRGVTVVGVDWTSGEDSDLTEPPLNLVLYTHLRNLRIHRILSLLVLNKWTEYYLLVLGRTSNSFGDPDCSLIVIP
jgi:hypothetical protein